MEKRFNKVSFAFCLLLLFAVFDFFSQIKLYDATYGSNLPFYIYLGYPTYLAIGVIGILSIYNKNFKEAFELTYLLHSGVICISIFLEYSDAWYFGILDIRLVIYFVSVLALLIRYLPKLNKRFNEKISSVFDLVLVITFLMSILDVIFHIIIKVRFLFADSFYLMTILEPIHDSSTLKGGLESMILFWVFMNVDNKKNENLQKISRKIVNIGWGLLLGTFALYVLTIIIGLLDGGLFLFFDDPIYVYITSFTKGDRRVSFIFSQIASIFLKLALFCLINVLNVEKGVSDSEKYGVGYIGMVKHVILLLLTFEIWNLIWIYKTTKYLNCTPNEKECKPLNKLLLCMFVPFYSIYWTYKQSQKIDVLAKTRGIISDTAALNLILEIFIGFVPPIIMQDKINKIVRSPIIAEIPETVKTPVQNRVESSPAFNVADELKKFKELFDCGVITQEEFEAKKKQLLGL